MDFLGRSFQRHHARATAYPAIRCQRTCLEGLAALILKKAFGGIFRVGKNLIYTSKLRPLPP